MSNLPEYFQNKSHEDQELFEDAFKAINENQAWNLLKSFPEHESFMFPKDEEINKLIHKIVSSMKVGHSGASFAYVMREIEYYVKHIASNL